MINDAKRIPKKKKEKIRFVLLKVKYHSLSELKKENNILNCLEYNVKQTYVMLNQQQLIMFQKFLIFRLYIVDFH
jgi:hypothetical protein